MVFYRGTNGNNYVARQHPGGIKELLQHTCTLRAMLMVSNDFEGCANSFYNNTGSIFRWRGKS